MNESIGNKGNKQTEQGTFVQAHFIRPKTTEKVSRMADLEQKTAEKPLNHVKTRRKNSSLLKEHGKIDFRDDQEFLGSEVEKLYASFSKDGRLYIDKNKKNFVPDWLLEYPKEFYIERESFKNDFKINFQEHPTLDEYKMLDINIIPFFLSNNIELPKKWALSTIYSSI